MQITRLGEGSPESASDLVSGPRFLLWVQVISFFALTYLGTEYSVVAA